ncbi:MAG: hypothetical protein DRP63_02140 [Planctomycetota bacterium]|nr:MAG: hypothetical protein DRP63_02140 [Planctomycetota bacterium]
MGAVFSRLLDSLEVAETKEIGDLKVTFFTSKQGGSDYLLLEEAVETGEVEVTEVEGGGSVPELKVINKSQKPLLLPEGGVLVGGKQNRVLNTSIFIGAKGETRVPVSCVEQGRWHWARKGFVASSRAHAHLRSLKAKSVTELYRRGERGRADQSAVWNEVARFSYAADFSSDTADLEETMTAAVKKTPEGERIKELKAPEEASAVMVHYRGTPFLFEFFSRKGAIARAWEGIKKAVVADIVRLQIEKQTEMPEEDFLKDLREAKEERHDSTGEGHDVRAEGDTALGFALEVGDEVLHAAAFPKTQASFAE